MLHRRGFGVRGGCAAAYSFLYTTQARCKEGTCDDRSGLLLVELGGNNLREVRVVGGTECRGGE